MFYRQKVVTTDTILHSRSCFIQQLIKSTEINQLTADKFFRFVFNFFISNILNKVKINI